MTRALLFVGLMLSAGSVPAWSAATAIAGGQHHSCAANDGSAYCWGYNNYGQVGDGTKFNASMPVRVR